MNKVFFSDLRPHSEAKLEVLNSYAVPWMRKISGGSRGQPCLIIDGFAGPGIYDDGSKGSPLLLLEAAVDFCEQAQQNGWQLPSIFLGFIESKRNLYERLCQNIKKAYGTDMCDIKGFIPLAKYQSIKVACIRGQFDHMLNKLLNRPGALIPTLCFADPFGYSHTPFDTIKRFLDRRGSELLLNFMYMDVNRFITEDQENMNKLFGTDEEQYQQLYNKLLPANPEQRKQLITDFYSRQLTKEAKAKHVLTFDIKKHGQTRMILFFATKHIEGLRAMKKVMWDAGAGSYVFDDRRDASQIQFSFLQEFDTAQHHKRLADLIYNAFGGQTVTNLTVNNFVLTDTPYPLEKYANPALRLLEQEGKINNVQKINGGTRRRGTFSEVSITFW